MQINNIQTYNNTNPNFKALRYKKGYLLTLSKMPKNVSEKIDTIKEKLSDTKHYHLDIGHDDFYISHENGEKYYLPIIINKAGKALIIKFRQGLSQLSRKLKYDNSKEVNQAYERIRQTSTQLERTAEIVKVLDEYEIKTAKK